MEVFSSVVVEISAAAFAFLPEDENFSCERHRDGSTNGCSSECFGYERADIRTDHRAKFLEEKVKALNVNVVVTCENSSFPASTLKLRGGWSDISAVRIWLMHFIQTTAHAQNIGVAEQLEADTGCETAVTKRCPESLSDRPRRSLRSCNTTKQLHTAKAALLSTVASSKALKGKQLKRSKRQRSKDLPTNAVAKQCKRQNCDRSEDTLKSHASSSSAKDKANVNSIKASVMDNAGTASTETFLVESASGTTEACSSLRQQPTEPLAVVESTQKLTLRCNSCDYVTGKQRNLLMHKARKHGDRSYVCQTCHRTFAIAKDLTQHLKCHTEQYCCEHCGQTLKSKHAVALHVARIHKGVAPWPVKRYLCTLCGKMCRNKTDYTIHRNKEHTGVRPFHCDVCNAGFFARANLRAHRQIHAETRLYECEQCGKAFKQRQGLRAHLAVHSGDRPYKCERCSKAFTQHSALVRHVRTHTSARPYSCRLCPATFNDYSVLRRHILGIHKLHDTTALRQCVQAACAEARLAEQLNTGKFEGSFPLSGSGTSPGVDSDVNSTVISSNNDDTVACTGMTADIPVSHLGPSDGHLLAVLSSSPHSHSDAQPSIADSLPRYFFIDTSQSVDLHQQST